MSDTQDYMFLFIGGQEAMKTFSPEEMQQHMEKWTRWMASMQEQGIFKGGNPLEQGGKTISGREKLVHDGPFAEAKEVVGGYIMISASSLEEATEIGKGCPIFENDGRVEVRTIRPMH